jgi:hypothetical protein
MVGNETDMTEHPDDILRALADPERLRIAGALAAGDAEAASLAETLELPLGRVRRHLTRLAAAGVARLQPDHRTYRLDRETLRWAAEQVGPPRDAGIALGAANEDEEAVLRAFFRDGRLTEIPAKAAKRRIVLERIAIEFEPGVRYDERQVDVIVGAYLNDHAALRRSLVDEGFLAREAGEYWRSGGRVDA